MQWFEGISAGMFLLCGIYSSWKLKGVSVRRFGAAMRQVFRGGGEGGEGELTSFQASCAALAAAVGTGNITGVAGAIALGGPGAVFWMWISAVLGMATKYGEIYFSVKYRDGTPFGYLRRVRRIGPGLAGLFCICTALAALGMGAMVQSSSLAEAVLEPVGDCGLLLRAGLGIGAAGITGLCISGGVRGVGKVSAILTPVMGGLYTLGALWVVAANGARLPGVFREIIASAFGLGPAAGGAWFAAVRWGVARGVFSNEAGLGSAALAHGESRETDPEREALWGIFEVFADTILMCTLTALALLVTDCRTVMGAFGSVWGAWGKALVVACSVLFALSSLFPWCMYGLRCARELSGGRARWYGFLFLLCVAAAPMLNADGLWQWAGVLNFCMAVPNVIAVAWSLREWRVES